MNFVPLNKRVLVKPAAAVTQTSSGIALPTDSQKRPTYGTVIATALRSKIRNGATVFWNDYSGTSITIDDEKYLCLKEEDLIGMEKQ